MLLQVIGSAYARNVSTPVTNSEKRTPIEETPHFPTIAFTPINIPNLGKKTAIEEKPFPFVPVASRGPVPTPTPPPIPTLDHPSGEQALKKATPVPVPTPGLVRLNKH